MQFALSTIMARGLPDARDGLKPSQRRILIAMRDDNLTPDRPHSKCAAIVGETMKTYHPHGDMAIYDALVRMAQDFSLRAPLVDGQGNFGSIDGDSPAAMRYTEVRMTELAGEMLKDIEKETVKFTPNFDGTLQEPTVLPSRVPNLLLNGSAGIAVGMATNIPPHNLNEIADAIISIIDGGTEEDLLRIVQGPDFPTGGTIIGKSQIINAYKTGRGIITVRGKAVIEKNEITIVEIPYQVNKTALIEQIVSAVKEKRIDGISNISDRSDRDGMALLIEVKRGEDPEIVLNQLYSFSDFQKSFGILNLALVDGEPKTLPLMEMVREFIGFRKDMIIARSKFDLARAQDRLHLLEGFIVALANIDSEKLTGLERHGIETEHNEKKEEIRKLQELLGDEKRILNVVKEETLELRRKYGQPRRTMIEEGEADVEIESLIPDEQVVITISRKGYIKRVPLAEYRAQRRGGVGKIGAETVEEDIIEDVFVTTSHKYILFFTDKGKVHWLKAYRIPEAGRYSHGKPIVNLIGAEGETVTASIAVDEFRETEYFFMATKLGTVKRVQATDFSNPRKGGIIAITLHEGDSLISVKKTNGSQNISLGTKKGFAIHFSENDVRDVGRSAAGVRGIKLRKGDELVSATVTKNQFLLTITENGYGKKTPVSEYRLQGRGGFGVINMKTGDRNGDVINLRCVNDDEDAILTTASGMLIRVPVKEISTVGRNTLGVRVIKLREGEKASSFTTVPFVEP
ncbi:MAG: DNA gyrase subunit A [Candidatus Micrarchaeota archaeon]|nr:DNA gyrase subunit A [Candidatus Micrarchaeota archaeon]